MPALSRRRALTIVGTAFVYLHGKEVRADNQARGLTLALDSVDALVVQYRGQRVVVTPQEIVEALTGTAAASPGFSPSPGGPGAPAQAPPWPGQFPPVPSKK